MSNFIDFLTSIKKLLKKIKKPYYYIPPCPNCGSVITGHFVKFHKDTENEWAQVDALKNGEIIDFREDLEGANCFCLDCSYEWEDDIKLSFASIEDIEAQKSIRHTKAILSALLKEKNEKNKAGKPLASVDFNPLKNW